MNLDYTNYFTITEYNLYDDIVNVHRFTGKYMFNINCKGIYRSDTGYLFNTKNYILTNITTDVKNKHYNAKPIVILQNNCPNFCGADASGVNCCDGYICLHNRCTTNCLNREYAFCGLSTDTHPNKCCNGYMCKNFSGEYACIKYTSLCLDRIPVENCYVGVPGGPDENIAGYPELCDNYYIAEPPYKICTGVPNGSGGGTCTASNKMCTK